MAVMRSMLLSWRAPPTLCRSPRPKPSCDVRVKDKDPWAQGSLRRGGQAHHLLERQRWPSRGVGCRGYPGPREGLDTVCLRGRSEVVNS